MHRRRVLQGLGLFGLASSFSAFANSEVAPKYLLLIQLRGGNDGLNTLAPFESDSYRRLRPRLGLRSNQVIPVGASIHEGALGLNSALARLVDQSWEQDLALITGVGYPAQDRSHFRSIQHWESGSDGQRIREQGWVTPSLDRLSGQNSIAGLSLVDHMRVFRGGSGIYSSFSRLSKMPEFTGQSAVTGNNSLLDTINRQKQNLTHATEIFAASLQESRNKKLPVQFSRSSFGRQMESVLRLASTGLAVPVIHADYASFDTHRSQRNRHNALLRGLANDLALLRTGLIKMGLWGQFLVMTYSEFGRTVKENANGGTDHGTANTHFLMGGRVRSGIYGVHPKLPEFPREPYQHTLDYRAIYDRVSRSWFGDERAPWDEYSDPALDQILNGLA